MTARGAGALLLGSALMLFALAVGNAAAFAIGAALLTLFASSLLAVLPAFLSLRVSQRLASHEVPRGTPCQLRVGLRMAAPLPVAPVLLALQAPEGEARFSVSARLWGTTETRLPFSCPHVGVFHVGLLQAEVCDCMGLFRLRRRPRASNLRLLSLPRAVPSEAHLPASSAGRPRGIRRSEAGWSYELRDWRAGDELRSVHWKVSARRGVLTVRSREPQRLPYTLVVVGGQVPPPPSDLTDAVCDEAMGCLRALAATHSRLRLVVPSGREIRLAALDALRLPALARALARTGYGRDAAAGALLLSAGTQAGQEPAPSAVCLFACALDDGTCDALLALCRRGIPVQVTLCSGDRAGAEALAVRLREGGCLCRLSFPGGKEAGVR